MKVKVEKYTANIIVSVCNSTKQQIYMESYNYSGFLCDYVLMYFSCNDKIRGAKNYYWEQFKG